ncbi:pentatricopeptide repeat-containing protein At2g20710, mitochondrial isoform X1 [Capsella rubella]|uniref:pentatricopeptide repeat-containing protein At2g20710, mitochondrial isoform X1 n=1 Tax=Capsella rubella TaxID=81985 RepID=UPI000CD5AC4D|nr:pentatricopeptide repeat-containing protein At2g20710, mitochondrial isoform X1 [Capsella rubella]
MSMNHLVRRSQLGCLLRILPCRFSIFRFPKTVPLLKNEEDLLREQEKAKRKKLLQKHIQKRKKRLELESIHQSEVDGEKMKFKGVPTHKVLASYILVWDAKGLEKYLNKLEENRPKGFALDMLRKSEPLLVTSEYYDILGPRLFSFLRLIYARLGEKEDLRRLWNLDDIEGAHEILEEWEVGEHHCSKVKIKDILQLDHYRKLVIEDTVSKVNDVFEDHKEEEEEEKKKTAMEVRRNGWDPKKNLALTACACFHYVDGQRDIESTVDVLRFVGDA